MKAPKILILLLSVLFLICGCQTSDISSESTTDAAAESVASELCLYENSTAMYSIVRPDAKNDFISAATTMIWKNLMETYGCELSLATDWVADPSEITADAPEILIGLTNRPESAEIYNSLKNLIYRVTVLNNRIVIAAATDSALETAANAFFNAVKVNEDGSITIPSDLDITYTAEQAWPFAYIPFYEGGNYNGLYVDCHTGFTTEDNRSHIFGITQTNEAEFNAYIEKVKDDGFTVIQRADWGNVLAYQCDKDDVSFYTYYTDGTKEVRIIDDNSASVPLEEFNYTYEIKEGETNDMFIYGIYSKSSNISGAENYPDNGQLLIVKLADNSLFVIDGGNTVQVNPDDLLTVMHEITGTAEDEPIRIACWFITHCHNDHFKGFWNFVSQKSADIYIERVLYNFLSGGRDFDLTATYPDILYHKPHTGETIELGGTTFEILFTQEDSMNITTMEYLPEEGSNSPENNASTVMKIHFDGKTCLILGDIAKMGVDIIQSYYTEEQLKADVVQVAHHGYNPMHNFYEIIDAKIALYPASETCANGKAAYNSIKSICEEIYFGGYETAGLRVVDGELVAFYRRPIIYQ